MRRSSASFLPRSAGEMRRKQKRLLQLAGLLLAALLFLPNVGLWSLYRDRVFDNSPDTVDGPGGIPPVQVRAGEEVRIFRYTFIGLTQT